MEVDHRVWLVSILFSYFVPFCLERMPSPTSKPSPEGFPGFGGPMDSLPPPQEFSRLELSSPFSVWCAQCRCRDPVVLGRGLGWGPNHIPDPGHKGRHLCVHIRSLGVPTPEAREGDKTVSPVPAHQRAPGVRLGVEGELRSGSLLWASLSL